MKLYKYKIMDNNKYDRELAIYIWQILNSQITILWSWGVDINTLKVIHHGLEFHVQGFIHTGMVQVELNESLDLFEISLVSDSGKLIKKINDVYFDQLISVIDLNIEKTDDYEERIAKEYGV